MDMDALLQTMGPMTGSPEYLKGRTEHLFDAFAKLLGVDSIKHVDGEPCTDCKEYISLPSQDPQMYVFAEHELSHWLFDTDCVLAQKLCDRLAASLSKKAGFNIDPLLKEKDPRIRSIASVIHSLWNVLEDYRCMGLWGQLYEGGAALLLESWKLAMNYETTADDAERNFTRYFCGVAVGTPDPPGLSQKMQDAKVYMQRALALVVGVDNKACLAITKRLTNQLIDLFSEPDVPNELPSGNTGGGGSGQGNKKSNAQRAADKAAQQHLDRLSEQQKKMYKGLERFEKAAPLEAGPKELGNSDTREATGASTARKDGQLLEVERIAQASDDCDGDGMSSFQQMLDAGEQAMSARIEEARKAMVRNQDTPEEGNKSLHIGWGKFAGIDVEHVKPWQALSAPSKGAYAVRERLRAFKMKRRTKRGYAGDLNVDALIDALGSGNMDPRFYDNRVRVSLFELLVLCDVSGSMMGTPLALVDSAIADLSFAVKAIKAKIQAWAYSDKLFIPTHEGKLSSAYGLRSGGTRTVQALEVAHRWCTHKPTTRALILLTDGLPTSLRSKNSTGNPITDLHAVLSEIRASGIPLGLLGVNHYGGDKSIFDTAFGPNSYSLASSFHDLSVVLPEVAYTLATAHIQKNLRNA